MKHIFLGVALLIFGFSARAQNSPCTFQTLDTLDYGFGDSLRNYTYYLIDIVPMNNSRVLVHGRYSSESDLLVSILWEKNGNAWNKRDIRYWNGYTVSNYAGTVFASDGSYVIYGYRFIAAYIHDSNNAYILNKEVAVNTNFTSALMLEEKQFILSGDRYVNDSIWFHIVSLDLNVEKFKFNTYAFVKRGENAQLAKVSNTRILAAYTSGDEVMNTLNTVRIDYDPDTRKFAMGETKSTVIKTPEGKPVTLSARGANQPAMCESGGRYLYYASGFADGEAYLTESFAIPVLLDANGSILKTGFLSTGYDSYSYSNRFLPWKNGEFLMFLDFEDDIYLNTYRVSLSSPIESLGRGIAGKVPYYSNEVTYVYNIQVLPDYTLVVTKESQLPSHYDKTANQFRMQINCP